MKRFVVVLVLMVLISPAVFSQQEHQRSVSAVPYGTLPLGSSGDWDD